MDIRFSGHLFALFFFFFFLLLCYRLQLADSGAVGVNYGRVADNLPAPERVVALLTSCGITKVKLFDADPDVLQAFSGSGISVTVALPNELLSSAASQPSFAAEWVQANISSHYPSTNITDIAVGNEVFADETGNLTSFLVPAMQNVHAALAALQLDSAIKISSPIALTALQTSYPSSAGSFRPDIATSVMVPILQLLRQTRSPLMVNAYPFFAYSANTDVISLDYALFRPNSGVVDPHNGLRYLNLLDAQLDAVFAAMAELGFNDVGITVSETGWPSKGDANETGASPENAAAYNGNLVQRLISSDAGTPMRPSADVDVYLFALFNEDAKPGPVSERNYGLFYPDEVKVYDVNFRGGSR